jgi:preprotein translocase subunit YajC
MACLQWLLLIAVEDDKKPAAPGSELVPFLPFIAIAIIFYFLLWRPQRREQSARSEMLKTLKKNDRVVTIGGMIGTVANISADGKEVTLKVDENTRIRMIRSSIERVLVSEVETEAAPENK